MDRILYKEADGDITCRSRDFDKVFPTLYAYEETCLTPEQIVAIKGFHTARQELIAENERLKRESVHDLILDLLWKGCTVIFDRDLKDPSCFYICIRRQDWQIIRGVDLSAVHRTAAGDVLRRIIEAMADELLGKDHRRTEEE